MRSGLSAWRAGAAGRRRPAMAASSEPRRRCDVGSWMSPRRWLVRVGALLASRPLRDAGQPRFGLAAGHARLEVIGAFEDLDAAPARRRAAAPRPSAGPARSGAGSRGCPSASRNGAHASGVDAQQRRSGDRPRRPRRPGRESAAASSGRCRRRSGTRRRPAGSRARRRAGRPRARRQSPVDGEQRGVVAAGRMAADEDRDADRRRARATWRMHPGERVGGVVEAGRKDVLGREPIAGADEGDARAPAGPAP